MDTKANLCQFCCKSFENVALQIIDEGKKEMLSSVQEMNIDLANKNLICTECVDNIEKFYNFKKAYLNKNWLALNGFVEDLKPMTTYTDIKREDRSMICEFCSKLSDTEVISIQNILIGENSQNICQKLLTIFNLVGSSGACSSCLGNLQDMIKFISCLKAAEEKFTKNGGNYGHDDPDVLANVKLEHDNISSIKFEDIIHESLSIKIEEQDDITNKYGIIKQVDVKENVMDIEDQPEHISLESVQALKQEESTDDKPITYNSKEERPVEGITFYKCEKCAYQTELNLNLRNHICGIVLRYKCRFCFLEITTKDGLRKHLKTHKEAKRFSCNDCPYATKYKSALVTHTLLHRRPETINMYKCEACPFETKHKRSLVQHSLIHKDPEDVVMYKCKHCDYATKYKKGIQSHLLTHKNVAETPMHHCDVCPFRTKHKTSLKKHYLTHKKPDEMTLYKCPKCSYETGYKSALERHELTHKDLTETIIYKCEKCTYETKHKYCYRRHLEIHNPNRTVPAVRTYGCELCEYTTKYKPHLKLHMLTHKTKEEVTMYECDRCGFETKHKRSLVIHVMGHRGIKAKEAKRKMKV